MAKPALEVAIYKGEDLLVMGTVRKVAEFMNIQQRTVRFYLSPAYKRRLKRFKKATSGINVINAVRITGEI